MAAEQVSTELLRQFSPLDGLKRDNLAALARKVQIRELVEGIVHVCGRSVHLDGGQPVSQAVTSVVRGDGV